MTVTSNNVSTGAANQGTSSTSALPGIDKLASEQTFLQLFVSQLKNQDPLNPADGTQFVTQLAQFSELEQVIGINQNVGAIRQQVAPGSSSDNSTQGKSAA
jgi:flagellar basal-body rod modification protein FlgD